MSRPGVTGRSIGSVGRGSTAAPFSRPGRVSRRMARWLISPAQLVTQGSRRYQPKTLVMETDLQTASGTVRLGCGSTTAAGSTTRSGRGRHHSSAEGPWLARHTFVRKHGPLDFRTCLLVRRSGRSVMAWHSASRIRSRLRPIAPAARCAASWSAAILEAQQCARSGGPETAGGVCARRDRDVELTRGPTEATVVVVPGNDAFIGGVMVVAESGWFAARP